MAAAIGYIRGMFQWTEKREGIIAPDERPPAVQSVALGLQHIFAMFGATVLAPILMGFDPNTAIFFSGIGTLIFFVCVRGRVPSYLGSSFSFIAVVISAEVGMRKPEERIFLHAAGLIGLAPSECVFIDDLEANVRVAEATGMRGVLHTEPAQTVIRLGELLGMPLG